VRGARALVVGAGSMAGLAVAHLSRRGVGSMVVVNRTADRAARLAAPVGAGAAGLDALAEHLARADVVVTCTGATGIVLGPDAVSSALVTRPADLPLAIVDLALPRDLDPVLAADPRIHYTGLATLADELANGPASADIDEVRRIVADEVTAFVGARRRATATPTVVALRSMATDVVDAELGRLWARTPPVEAGLRAEVEQAVRRVAGKLLHAPTTRVKELTGQPAGMSYAEVLAELFSLPSGTADALTRAVVEPTGTAVEPPGERQGDLP